jgi:hypothetical protein
MKPEVLVQKQFDEAKEAWKDEKHALQTRINELEVLAVGGALAAKPTPPVDAKAAAKAEQKATRAAKKASKK